MCKGSGREGEEGSKESWESGKLGELKSTQMNLYLYCRLHMCVNMREAGSVCVRALSVRECMNVCMYICVRELVCMWVRMCVCVYVCVRVFCVCCICF